MDDIQKAKHAKQALPGKITITVEQDFMGDVCLTPTESWIRDLVGQTNLYNGAYEAWIDHWDVHETMQRYPEAWYEEAPGMWILNEGVEFDIDADEFCSLCGGQLC